MIHLIVGGIGSGKSALLKKIYAGSGRGDGIVNQRLFHEGAWVGQEIMRLATGSKTRFSFRDGHAPQGWDGLWRLGDLTISRGGMAFAGETFEDIIRRGVSPVFLDEIGPLELAGHGLHRHFVRLVDLGMTVYAAVREACLDEAVEKYGLENFALHRP